MQRIKVCHTAEFFSTSGTGTVIFEVTKRLSKMFDTTILSKRFLRKAPEGVNCIQTGGTLLNYLRTLGKIGNNFDIIHVHTGIPAFYALRLRKPVVYTHHGIKRPWTFKRGDLFYDLLCEVLLRYSIPRMSACIGISDYIVEELVEKYKTTRARLIPNGVDSTRFQKTKLAKTRLYKFGNPMILYVGYLLRHKGVHILVNSWVHILKEFPEAKLVLLGRGSPDFTNRLEKLARNFGVETSIRIIGPVNDDELPYYYNACDVFVTASYWEGFCLPILEAMACGKPVVARNAYATADLVSNSKGGELFQSDDPREICSAIHKVISNYQEYSRNALRYVKDFSWDKNVKETSRLYQLVLNEWENR